MYKVGDRVKFKTLEDFKKGGYAVSEQMSGTYIAGLLFGWNTFMCEFFGKEGSITSVNKCNAGFCYSITFDDGTDSNTWSIGDDMLITVIPSDLLGEIKIHTRAYTQLIQLEDAGILDQYMKNKDYIRLYLEEVSS